MTWDHALTLIRHGIITVTEFKLINSQTAVAIIVVAVNAQVNAPTHHLECCSTKSYLYSLVFTSFPAFNLFAIQRMTEF